MRHCPHPAVGVESTVAAGMWICPGDRVLVAHAPVTQR